MESQNKKYKLGDLIELCDERNSDGKYQISDVKGISTEKVFIDTKANLDGVSLNSYKIIRPGHFAYVPDTSRRGDKIALAYNDSENDVIISSIYTTFFVSKVEILNSEYLFMFFNRPEFDRFSRYNSWGSARETFNWDDFCDTEIVLPPLNVQEKYVAIYKAMKENLKSYESGIEDLKLICDGYIEELRRNSKCLHKIGEYITIRNETNDDGQISLEQGININKEFITPQRSNSNLLGRKIVRHGDFAYCTQLNNSNVAIAYREGKDCVVSSVYNVFYIIDEKKLFPEYLMLWLVRPEFGRYVYWSSVGSAYEFLNYENLHDFLIPVPSMNVQTSIAAIYKAYIERQRIAKELREKIKEICPILIRGSLEYAD